ncbi:MAG: transposase [Actinomycetota bacterium]|nr:transposase [Actinomycetota bacterium]
MARQLRTDLPDGIFHVTARGVDSCPIFLDDEDRLFFLRLLAQAVERHGWSCHAFCLMGTHYHLIVATTCDRLSRGFHRLNGFYAQTFNRRHDRTGHLFGDRFASWVVDTEDHLRAACRYVMLNPVRAGLCAQPQDWRWSGLRNG